MEDPTLDEEAIKSVRDTQARRTSMEQAKVIEDEYEKIINGC
jgi:hypothetical protein